MYLPEEELSGTIAEEACASCILLQAGRGATFTNLTGLEGDLMALGEGASVADILELVSNTLLSGPRCWIWCLWS